MSDFMADHFRQAEATLQGAKLLLDQAGLNYVDVPSMFGRSVALSWGDENFVLVSVAGPPNDHSVFLTCPVLGELEQNRTLLLEQCNYFTWSNPAFPVFLHDAEEGWAVLVATSDPAAVFHQVAGLLVSKIQGIRGAASVIRQGFLDAGARGSLWEWRSDHLSSLATRSVS